MVQTGAALAIIAITLLAGTALFFATIKYVSEVLEEGDHEEGNASSGGRAA
ncbi:hypothetical protein [Haloarcula nitratireducens]|uniref:Uncharacterized protein n=1 Tax=Haloarcula nitratireducens TaxID=2487749 RepID=A0AAW4P7L7_9EURY|nr:hypothetical protein [Halomicroarcula nitratireducens]MBX0293866.1 hypothetical protein [Halomicroarcula nitratireducens]